MKLRLVLGMVAALSLSPAITHADDDEKYLSDIIQEQYAKKWIDAFRVFSPRVNNVTVVVTNRGSYYEITNVLEIDTYSRFLLVKYESDKTVCRAVLYPTSVILIKEIPRTASSAKASLDLKKQTPASTTKPEETEINKS